MNCTEIRTRLPLLLYHDLKPDEVAAVENHLTTCAACRHEHAGLARVRGLLAAVPAPSIDVDVSRVFQQVADRQARRARLWRRAAVALCGLAAALLVAVACRLEIRVETGQLVLRWGWPPDAPDGKGRVKVGHRPPNSFSSGPPRVAAQSACGHTIGRRAAGPNDVAAKADATKSRKAATRAGT